MTKEERREAFGGALSATLTRVVDFLKFAETKNAALLTFASAWTFASINFLVGDRPPPGVVGGAFRLALPLFAIAAVVAVVSFLPRLNLKRLHRDPAQELNLLYFGDIAAFDAAAFRSRVRDRYMPEAGQSVTEEYLDDLIVQISANSTIARQKYVMFNWGAALVLFALVILAAAAGSAAMHRATGGALGWA